MFKMASQETLRLFLFVALGFFPLISAKPQCKKIDTCSCLMDDDTGRLFSLHSIDNKNGTPRFRRIPSAFSPTYTFDWNPCNACEYTPDPYPIGLPNTNFSVNDDGTVLLTYGKVTYQDYLRLFVVTLKCDATAEGSFGDGISENAWDKGSFYTGTFTSRCACPDACW